MGVNVDMLTRYRGYEDPSAGISEEFLPQIVGGNPARELSRRETREKIDEALGKLSPNHRAVLVMRELEGLSYEDMAQAMNCSKGTIMSRLFHARRNMQKRLLDLLDHPSPELVKELTGESADDPEPVEARAPAARSR